MNADPAVAEAELCHRLSPFQSSLCMTQYRLSRSLEAAIQSSTPAALRRLGSTLQRANRLIAAVQHSTTTKSSTVGPVVSQTASHDKPLSAVSPLSQNSPSPRLPAPGSGAVTNPTESSSSVVNGEEAYEVKLAELLDVLLRDVVRGYTFLDTQLRAAGLGGDPSSTVSRFLKKNKNACSSAALPSEPLLLPLSAVGTLAVVYDGNAVSASTASQPVLCLTSHASVAPCLPPLTYVEVTRAHRFSAPAVARANPTAESASGLESAADGPPREEDEEAAVLSDVQSLVSQVRQHAVQMSEWMRGEDNALLLQNEALFSAGVRQNEENMAALGQLPDGKPRRPTPALLAQLPMGKLVWEQVVLPMWAVLQQALLLLLIISVTGITLLVIVMRSKPTTYQRSDRLPPAITPITFSTPTTTSTVPQTDALSAHPSAPPSMDTGVAPTTAALYQRAQPSVTPPLRTPSIPYDDLHWRLTTEVAHCCRRTAARVTSAVADRVGGCMEHQVWFISLLSHFIGPSLEE